LGFVSRPHGSHPAEITDVVIGNYDILKISKVTGKVSAEIQNGMAINYKEYFVNGAGVFLKSYNYNMFAAFSPEATIQPGTKMSYLEMEGFAWIVQQNQSTAGNTSIKILSYDMYNGVDGEFSAPGTTNTSAYLLDQNGQVPTAAIHWLDDKKVEGMVIAESRYEFGKGQYSPIFAFIPDAQAELSASETNAGVYTITTDGRLKFLKRIRTP
jgi:hypothetical protein